MKNRAFSAKKAEICPDLNEKRRKMINNSEKESICVFYASVAKSLLKDGYQIIDLKPDKFDSDKKRTIFVFKNQSGLVERIEELRTKELNQKVGQTNNERKFTTREKNMAV